MPYSHSNDRMYSREEVEKLIDERVAAAIGQQKNGQQDVHSAIQHYLGTQAFGRFLNPKNVNPTAMKPVKSDGSVAADGDVVAFDGTHTYFESPESAGLFSNTYGYITTTKSDTSDLTITCDFEPRAMITMGSVNPTTSSGTIGFGFWSADGPRNHAAVALGVGTSTRAVDRDTTNAECFLLIDAAGTMIKQFGVSSTSSTGITLTRSTNDATNFAMFALLLG